MKRILLMLVLLTGVVTSAWAEKTPQAIWCRNNKTMYFTNDETVYIAPALSKKNSLGITVFSVVVDGFWC